MMLDERPQPFAQATCALGNTIKLVRGVAFRSKLGCDVSLDRTGLLKPVDEIGSVAKPIGPHARGRRPGVEEVKRQVIADKKGRGTRGRSGGHGRPDSDLMAYVTIFIVVDKLHLSCVTFQTSFRRLHAYPCAAGFGCSGSRDAGDIGSCVR